MNNFYGSGSSGLGKHLNWSIVLIVIALLATLWLQVPRLADEFQVEEDFRSFYWMNKFRDQTLFSSGQTQRFTTIHLPWGDVPITLISLGYSLLFYASSFFVPPIFFSKILAFILVPIATWYMFALGQSVRNRRVGIVLAIGFLFLNLASTTAISMIHGLQRSFATLLMIMLIYYLYRQKYIMAAIIIVASALIYAPMFALAGVTWGLSTLRVNWHSNPKLLLAQRGIAHLLIAFCVGTLILLPSILPRFANVFASKEPVIVEQHKKEDVAIKSTETYKYLWNNPIYRAGGRRQLFVNFPFIGRGGLVDLGQDLVNLLVLFVISCLIYLVRGRYAFDLPNEIWCMLWATITLFIMSWLSILGTNSFLLYLPSRYTRVGLFLFLLMFVLLNGEDTIREALGLIRRNPQRLIWLIVGVELLIMGLVLLYPSDQAMIKKFNMKWLLAATGFILGILGIVKIRKQQAAISTMPGLGQNFIGRILLGVTIVFCLSGWAVYARTVSGASYLNPPQVERQLLKFLETLPKDVLIAGTPCALDNVQLFAKRQILFGCERGGGNLVVRDALNAYYADDPQVIMDFCQSYNVDYLVIGSYVYTTEYLSKEKIYYEPYHQEIHPKIMAQSSFVLSQIPDASKVFARDPFSVIKCDAETIQSLSP